MNAKIRTLSAILLTACMLVSGMLFGAFAENEPATPTDLAPIGEETPAEPGTGEVTAPVKGAGIGKHAVYFVFSAEGDGPAAEMDRFTFD